MAVSLLAMTAGATGVVAAPLDLNRAWYVGPAGNDANPGTPASPFLTIQHAVDAAASGDTVRVFDGLYSGAGNAGVSWSDRNLTLVSHSGNREDCVIDCAGADGFRFVDTVLADSNVVTIAGFSFVDADTAIAVLRVGFGYGTPVDMFIRDCRVAGGKVGVASHGGRLVLDDCVLADNEVAGIHGGYSFGLTMTDCQVRGNGTGLLYTQMNGPGPVLLENSDFALNGVGIRYWQESAGMIMRHCRVDSSLTGHGIRSGTDYEGLLLEDCKLRDNAKHGLANTQGTAVTATDCVITGNGMSGIAIAGSLAALDLQRVTISGNDEWGIGQYVFSPLEKPMVTDKSRRSPDKDPANHFLIADCDITGNGLGGVSVAGAFDPILVSDSTIAANVGPGLVLNGTIIGGNVGVERVTVVANHGVGLDIVSGEVQATRALVSHNLGTAVAVAGTAVLTLNCTDLFGNAGGDWTAPVLPQLGANGNRYQDPLYCDLDGGDYSLRQNSQLSAANSGGCETIGRFDWTCPALPDSSGVAVRVHLRDVPGDEGGALHATWPRHELDDLEAAEPVLEYQVQHLQEAWQTVATVAAAAADSYTVTVPTPSVLVVGQPAPYCCYRLVAVAAGSTVVYESQPDSAYSIDNLPPPRPDAGIADGLDYRVVYWEDPGIPDLASSCVFRGTEEGFIPVEPLICGDIGHYIESHLAWYFYRVQFTDIHGNVSEFSDELHGQYPTPAPPVMPSVVTLHPNRPNPFNPQTAIGYDMPRQGRVRLSVFDLAGRRVRQLVDGVMGAGRHEVVWDGRDASGMRAASGSYVVRLEADGILRTLIVGLVK